MTIVESLSSVAAIMLTLASAPRWQDQGSLALNQQFFIPNLPALLAEMAKAEERPRFHFQLYSHHEATGLEHICGNGS